MVNPSLSGSMVLIAISVKLVSLSGSVPSSVSFCVVIPSPSGSTICSAKAWTSEEDDGSSPSTMIPSSSVSRTVLAKVSLEVVTVLSVPTDISSPSENPSSSVSGATIRLANSRLVLWTAGSSPSCEFSKNVVNPSLSGSIVARAKLVLDSATVGSSPNIPSKELVMPSSSGSINAVAAASKVVSAPGSRSLAFSRASDRPSLSESAEKEFAICGSPPDKNSRRLLAPSPSGSSAESSVFESSPFAASQSSGRPSASVSAVPTTLMVFPMPL